MGVILGIGGYLLGVFGSLSIFRGVEPAYHSSVDWIIALAWPLIFPGVGVYMIIMGILSIFL